MVVSLDHALLRDAIVWLLGSCPKRLTADLPVYATDGILMFRKWNINILI